MGDGHIEGDLVPKTEVVHIVVEVLGDLAVVGKIWEILRHGIVREGHFGFGGVDMERPVRGRPAVLVVEHPVTAKFVALLETIERDAAGVKLFARCDAARPGADHTNLRILRHNLVLFVSLLGCYAQLVLKHDWTGAVMKGFRV